MSITDTIEVVLKNKAFNTVLPLGPEQTVFEALQIMAEHDVGSLVVRSGDKLVGLFTERDYARKCFLLGHPSKETLVSQIMTTDPICVTPRHTVDDCMAIMAANHIRYLPVVDGEKVVGMISTGDLVKWVIRGQQHAIEVLQGYITGGYAAQG